MSAASSTVQAGSSTRQLGSMALALLLAAAVFAVLAYGQLAASRQGAAPATVTTPVVHDHGWSSATSGSTKAWAIDPDAAKTDAARHPSKRFGTVTPDGIKVTGATGGGILFMGIPYTSYPTSADGGAGGSIRGRLPQ